MKFCYSVQIYWEKIFSLASLGVFFFFVLQKVLSSCDLILCCFFCWGGGRKMAVRLLSVSNPKCAHVKIYCRYEMAEQTKEIEKQLK